MQKYDVAAYIWPAYTGKEGRTRIFWPEGHGEWETVKEAVSRFPGHQWPRKPLWGYQDEADPEVMEFQIDQAVSHGVNVFIYDWYWYDNRPFLEQCLNDGFLKAKNRSKMKFYLMWANHDVPYGWDRRISTVDYNTVIWQGFANHDQFREIANRWMEKYFGLDEYYRIDGKPVLSICDLNNFIKGFGSLENAAAEMRWLDSEAKARGLGGVHFQLIHLWDLQINLSGFDQACTYSPAELTEILPFDSVTHYQFAHFAHMNQNYSDIRLQAEEEWDKIAANFKIPYYPHVSVGWDNTPRYYKNINNVVKNNTPDEIEKALSAAKKFAEKTGVHLITVNSWNEWTETSYLEPDDLYGYGYLDAVKKVFLEGNEETETAEKR